MDFFKLFKYENLTYASKIDVKKAKLKSKEEYNLYLEDISKVVKDYIEALEDME